MFTGWNLVRSSLKMFATTATVGGVGTAAFLISDERDKINGTCEFSEHTKKQRKLHPFSGMHSPFLTSNTEELQLFYKHYANFSHLLPQNIAEFQERQALQTPVKIRPLTECPVLLASSDTLLAVGGPPALITATAGVEAKKSIVYMNDKRRWPIAYGSAWHLEEDADAEGPTSYPPLRFMKDQILRAFVKREQHSEIEKTGLYPWRTLDWMGYAKDPGQWFPAFKLAMQFQLQTMQTAESRKAMLDKVASQCALNETFYHMLNEKLGGKLLLSGQGSIIIARTESEVNDLHIQQENLVKEGRSLNMLSHEDIKKRFGFVPKGLAFAEKPHDRILSPNYQTLLTEYIQQHGGTIIDGTLTTVYTDNKKPGGVAKYQTPDAKEHYIAFEHLILSLGNQQIFGINNKPLFNMVGATGSSGLAHLYTPVHYKLPRVSVFGGTNHVTVLSKEPIPVTVAGKNYHLELIRFTSSACITPRDRGKESAHYDGTIGLGLVNTLYKTLGEACIVKPLTVYGCNRMVSQYGQTTWMKPYPGIYIQYGAGGGGLTRAPDLATELFPINKNTPRPSPRA